MSKDKKQDVTQPSVEECGIYLLMDEISDASCKDVITFIISNMISSFRCPGKYNIPTSGSWWCLMAFTLPILSIFTIESDCLHVCWG